MLRGVGYLTVLGETGKPSTTMAYQYAWRLWSKARRVRVGRPGMWLPTVSHGRCGMKKIYANADGTLRFTHNGAAIARVNAGACASSCRGRNAFLEAETTAIESVAVRRIRRAYRKKHPEWREEWDRVLRANMPSSVALR